MAYIDLFDQPGYAFSEEQQACWDEAVEALQAFPPSLSFKEHTDGQT